MEIKNSQKKLIICADDFGYSAGINRGIIKSLKKGIVTSSDVMINSSLLGEILDFHQQNPECDLGLHLTFNFSKEKIYDSMEKQIIKFCKLFKQKPSHLSIHCAKEKIDSFKKYNRKIFFYLKIINEKYKIHIRGKEKKSPISFSAKQNINHAKKEFKNILTNKISEGINEIIVHPGSSNDVRLNSSYNAAMRGIETKILTSKTIDAIIKKEQIKLFDYKIFS